MYKTCLACNDEIRERVYEHVDVLISRVSPVVGWDMFEDLARAWKDGSLGGWRAREQLALHLPKMLELFRDVEKGEKVLDVLRDALLDPFAAVRDGVTKGVGRRVPLLFVRLTGRYRTHTPFWEMIPQLRSVSGTCCWISAVPLYTDAG